MTPQVETIAEDLDTEALDQIVGGLTPAVLSCRKTGGQLVAGPTD